MYGFVAADSAIFSARDHVRPPWTGRPDAEPAAGAEKAGTNFTRDPRHRRHKCLTRNSVTYSVLCVCTCSWKLLASASARCLDEERGENPGQETAQAIVQSYETRSRWRGIAWHVMTNATNTSCPLSHDTWKACPRILLAFCKLLCLHILFSCLLPGKQGWYIRISSTVG